MKFEQGRSLKLLILSLLVYSAFDCSVQARVPECKFLRGLLVARLNYAKKFRRDQALVKNSHYSPPNKQFFANFLVTDDREVTFFGLDIDKDGQEDNVRTNCVTVNSMFADGCTLEFKVSSSRGFKKEGMGVVDIVTYKNNNYALERWDNDPIQSKIQIYKIMSTDLKRICEIH